MSKITIGIDEAGRGPLAGPLVVAGVLSAGFKRQKNILALVDDSKKIKEQQREDLFWSIVKNFFWSVRLLDNRFIDKYGIQAANILLVHEIAEELLSLGKKPASIVADYVGGAGYLLRGISFYKNGESQFKEIAAASIVAKVYRDHLMQGIDQDVVGYDFSRHKGYGTKDHFDLLTKRGVSSVHRRSFLKNFG